MADGSFAVWDSERNHASRNGNELSTAFVFSHREVFNGLSGKGDTKLCNGLITDWAMWSDSFSYAPLAQQMDAVLKVLSPIGACYQVGVPRRVCVSDARRVPTIKMPYGEEDSEGSEVPVTQASSGIKRIVALAYMLTWAVNEHAEVVKRKGKDMERRVTLLVDDVDSHLNPRWQASIVSSILEAIEVLFKKLGSSFRTQLFMTTHSPIVLASIKDSCTRPWISGSTCILKRGLFQSGTALSFLHTQRHSEVIQSADAPGKVSRRPSKTTWQTDHYKALQSAFLHVDLRSNQEVSKRPWQQQIPKVHQGRHEGCQTSRPNA